MLVERTKIKETNYFKVGDIIRFKLNNGEEIKAMAVKKCNTGDKGMLFVTVDCINKRKRMFDKDHGEKRSYHNSDLRKFLNNELLLEFPKEIQKLMLPVYILDKIRIPTKSEIFGENVYGHEKSKFIKYWKPMKKKRNRIALQRKEDTWEWYWLMNRHKDYNHGFAFVNSNGDMDYVNASNSLGVRPVFRLLNEYHD